MLISAVWLCPLLLSEHASFAMIDIRKENDSKDPTNTNSKKSLHPQHLIICCLYVMKSTNTRVIHHQSGVSGQFSSGVNSVTSPS